MSILEVFRQLPARAYVVVPNPMNKEVLRPVTLCIVKNLFDLPFPQIIDKSWMLLQRWLSYDRWCVVGEPRHMEDFVIAQCSRQVKFVSILFDYLIDRIWSSAHLVELL